MTIFVALYTEYFLGMEEKIHREVHYTIQHIKDLIGAQKDSLMSGADRFFEVPNLNVIWGLVAAIRYDYNDSKPREQFDYLRAFLGEKNAGPLTFVPWLKFLPPFYTIYHTIIKAMDNFRSNLLDIIEEQR